jgi:hypothetical protein
MFQLKTYSQFSLEWFRYFDDSATSVSFEETEPISTLKHQSVEVFLSKTNSTLTDNNVLHATASNIDPLLSRDTCVSSTQMKRPILSRSAYLQLETPK